MEDFSSLPLAERERILARLAKLKALAECPTGNVNETATAAAHMTRLMLEYRIEVAELQPPPAIQEEEVTGQVLGRSFPGWQNGLLGQLARANDCVGYETRDTGYYPWGQPVHQVRLCLMGSPENVAQVRTLYLWCLEAIERLCHAWEPRARVRLKNDFRRGAALAIGQKALAEREAVRAEEEARARAQGEQSRALAVLDRQLAEVQQAAARRGVETVHKRSRPAVKLAYEAGFEAGTRLQLPGPTPPQVAGRG